jgi:tetratricopeptide (TPR) repeat protein
MSRQLQNAIEHHRAGRLQDAEAGYRLVLKQSPRNADALSLLGVALEALGRADEAVVAIKKAVAIDPKAALFRLHLGTALVAAKKYVEAVTELRLATGMSPTMPEAHYNLGNALRLLGNHDDALAAYRTTLKLAPQMLQARMNLGLTLAAQKKYDEALVELRATLQASPGNFEVQLAIANVTDQKGDEQQLFIEAQQLLRLAPTEAQAHFMFGLALNRQFRDDEAIEVYEHALKLDPKNPEGWDNFAQSLQGAGKFERAEQAFRKARELRLDDPDINYHNALIDLLRGNLAEGFKNYGWRWRTANVPPRPPLGAPLWDGSDPTGKTILIYDEQGFGDSIMFCRYLPLLRQRGAKVIYACRKPLAQLLAGWNGADEIVAYENAPNIQCDFHAAMMDLPGLFGTVLETVPALPAYLMAQPLTPATTLPPASGKKVGVVWMGSKHHKHDRRRSVPLEQFKTLFDVPGVNFYTMVRPSDIRPEEAPLLASLPVTDLGGMINDFADTARIMQQLDLVITVDTSTAHLAGALGKPVWVLLPLGPDWRWLTERTDSVWYPTARLFRQTKTREWDSVLEQVKQALNNL